MILTETRQKIIAKRIANPCATMESIGQEVGLTRERVRQILKSHHLPTSSFRQHYSCLSCGADIGTMPHRFCNRKCQHGYTHIKVVCSYCGGLSERRASSLIIQMRKGQEKKHLFCSKTCQGKWLAENYGRKKKNDKES